MPRALGRARLAIVPVTVGAPIYDGCVELKGAPSPWMTKRLKKSGVEFERGARLLLDFS